MNWELLAEADALGIAITGMVIVFSGLAGISIFIAALPRILAKLHALAHGTPSKQKKPVNVAGGAGQNEEELAAIAFVIEAERQFLMEEDLRVMGLPEQSSWSFADKMRTLPSRANG